MIYNIGVCILLVRIYFADQRPRNGQHAHSSREHDDRVEHDWHVGFEFNQFKIDTHEVYSEHEYCQRVYAQRR